MEEISLQLLTYVNMLVFIMLYVFMSRYRKVVGFHLGMNIAMVTGGMLSLSVGVLLMVQYPFHFIAITFLSTILGMVAGGIFGALFDYQTMLTGLSNGLMVGIMAPMLGAILINPFLFIVMMEGLICFMIVLLVISLRRS